MVPLFRAKIERTLSKLIKGPPFSINRLIIKG